MAAPTAVPMQLVQLPDPCLVAVMQCCADDKRNLFSAARAHSRLHQAAVEALSSITLGRVTQQRVDGLLQYLSKHGQHVDSVELNGDVHPYVALRQLPPGLQLGSLKLTNVHLQLQPGDGFQGVVRPGLPLKQLRLHNCTLLGGPLGLAAALPLLPGLQHLSIRHAIISPLHGGRFAFPAAGVLAGLQHLTHLEVAGSRPQGPDRVGAPALQPLQALTRLADLRLTVYQATAIASSVLSGMQHLTRLELTGFPQLDPGVLAGKAQLQHLKLACCLCPGAAELVQLLSELQSLQQLTHLSFGCHTLDQGHLLPAAAFSALTAGSKLQHLGATYCKLPAGVWQHVFPAGRQLPQLLSLDISRVQEPSGATAAAPDGTRLVSCCPGLQSLDMQHLRYDAELLAALQGLSGLRTLLLAGRAGAAGGVLGVVCQLTGLRELSLGARDLAERQFLQVTGLKQLTSLTHTGFEGLPYGRCVVKCQAPGDEPVWRQVLRHHLDHSDPAVAQQAAAALADSHSE